MVAQTLQQQAVMDCHAATDRGQVRETNQDRFLIADVAGPSRVVRSNLNLHGGGADLPLTRDWLLGVADGMGGLAAGDRAAYLAIETAGAMLRRAIRDGVVECGDEQAISRLMRNVVATSDERLKQDVCENPENFGMGTTLTMGYLTWPYCYGVHAGDSRCYLFRRGAIGRVTNDHTFAQLMVDRSGKLEEEIPSRWHHMLWNFVGSQEHALLPDVFRIDLLPGDALLFCSDGLTRHLDEDEIASYLCIDRSAEETCNELIARVNEEGARDNVTVLLAQFD